MGLLNKLKKLVGLTTVTSQEVRQAPAAQAPVFKDVQGVWGKQSLNYWEIERARKRTRRAKAMKRARHLNRVHA